jgi:hypothetical protein
MKYRVLKRRQKMPHRHWFAILTINGVERRKGPYASRKTAEREAHEAYRNASHGDVRFVYDVVAPMHTGRA